MVEFESLPPKSRSLILATLGLEIASADCASIFELARKRYQTVSDVWRDVCKKTGQPRCTMPSRVLGVDYAASTAEPKPAGSPVPAAAPANVAPVAASANASVFVGATAAPKIETPAPAPAPVVAKPRAASASPELP